MNDKTHDLVLVERMPVSLRESHIAAGNPGVWPMNGAERHLMHRRDAEALAEGDEDWTWVLRDATTSDLRDYDVDDD